MSERAELEKLFLLELEQLAKRYKIVVSGCGCCGSPWLEHIENTDGMYTYDRQIVWEENE